MPGQILVNVMIEFYSRIICAIWSQKSYFSARVPGKLVFQVRDKEWPEGFKTRNLKREHNKQELFKWKEKYFLEVSTISVGGTTLWWMLPKIEIRNLFHRTAPTVTDFRLESRPRAFLSEIELFLSFKLWSDRLYRTLSRSIRSYRLLYTYISSAAAS